MRKNTLYFLFFLVVLQQNTYSNTLKNHIEKHKLAYSAVLATALLGAGIYYIEDAILWFFDTSKDVDSEKITKEREKNTIKDIQLSYIKERLYLETELRLYERKLAERKEKNPEEIQKIKEQCISLYKKIAEAELIYLERLSILRNFYQEEIEKIKISKSYDSFCKKIKKIKEKNHKSNLLSEIIKLIDSEIEYYHSNTRGYRAFEQPSLLVGLFHYKRNNFKVIKESQEKQ